MTYPVMCVKDPKEEKARTKNVDCILQIGNISRPKIMSEIRVVDSEMKWMSCFQQESIRGSLPRSRCGIFSWNVSASANFLGKNEEL